MSNRVDAIHATIASLIEAVATEDEGKILSETILLVGGGLIDLAKIGAAVEKLANVANGKPALVLTAEETEMVEALRRGDIVTRPKDLTYFEMTSTAPASDMVAQLVAEAAPKDGDGWIAWFGGESAEDYPEGVETGTIVEVRIASGKEFRHQQAREFDWAAVGEEYGITHYKIVS